MIMRVVYCLLHAGCRHLVLYWTRLACMGDDDSFVFRYENDALISAQVNYPSESTRQQQADSKLSEEVLQKSTQGGTVLHSIQPADRDDIALLLARLQSSRLLRLVILAHQQDAMRHQQDTVKEEEASLTPDPSALDSDSVPEMEIMRQYFESNPFLVKSMYKYFDGDAPMWTNHRLG